MLTLNIDAMPYAQDLFHTAHLQGERGVARLVYYAGEVHGLPGKVSGLIMTSDLQGRWMDGDQPLLGVGVARALTSRHAQRGLPPPDQCIAVLAGDFFADPEAKERGASGDIKPVWAAFGTATRRVVGVAGNHDVWEPRSPWGPFMDGQMNIVDGIRIAGISGIIADRGNVWRRPAAEFISLLAARRT